MGALLRDLFLFAVLAAAVTLAASLGAWWFAEGRRLRRTLRRALRARPDALLVGLGRGAALDLARGHVALAWGGGARSALRGLDRLMALELIADGRVAGRASRDDGRRPLDQIGEGVREVVLRFVFDDPRHPDFSVPLWRAQGPPAQGEGPSPALEAARAWLARAEAILRAASPPRVRTGAEPEDEED